MFKLIKLLVGMVLVVGVVVVAGVVVLSVASPSETKKCPAVTASSKTDKAIGDALSSTGTVEITNGDATSVGRSWVGSAVSDLRVCFDPAGGHASGAIAAGPLQVPFYVTAASIDLTGRHPSVSGLSFQLGGLPDALLAPVKSTLTDLINDNLDRIELAKKYSYQLGEGKVTLKAI